MNDTETAYRERIAAALEGYAAELRGNDCPAYRVKDIAGFIFDMVRGGGTFDTLANVAEVSEYYDCPSCGHDFHTAAERDGSECRELQRN